MAREATPLTTHWRVTSASRAVKPTIEVRVEDLDRVLGATGIDRAVVVDCTGSTQTALAFAALRPERTRAIILYSAVARQSEGEGYEFGVPDEVTELALETTESAWGTGVTASLYAPSLSDDRQFSEWSGRMERSTATPVESRQWIEMYSETNVRDILPLVHAPALVVTPALAGDPVPQLSRYVADHLVDVRSIEIPAHDQYPMGDGMGDLLDAVTDFLVEVAELDPVAPKRRLATVLFTDLVASTEQQQSMGDQRWSTTLDSHDDAVRRAVTRNGGRVIKSTGDGVLAIFDGPASSARSAIEILRSVRRLGLSDLVAGSGLRFEPRGPVQLKGIQQPVELLAVRPDSHR